jgi:hypothetical protein
LPAATYYIDWTGGDDTNNGTSTGTPWKRMPGMNGCASNCAANTPGPGDSYILKGGVTWPNAAFGILWTWSGNATTTSPGCTGSGCIYIGVDAGWYTGASWSRPIFDAGGTATTTRDGVANTIMRLYANYVIVDNIEFKGLHWTGVPAYGSSVMFAFGAGTPGVGTNDEAKNLYFHGWTHGTFGSGTSEHPCAVIGDTGIPNNNANSILHSSVIDGSDTAQDSCSAIFGGPPYIERNYIRNVSSGMIINGTVRVDGNTILDIRQSFDTGAHTNGIEVNAALDHQISNNVIAHLETGTLAIWTAPNSGYVATLYNNVVFDTDTGNVIDIAAPATNNGCASSGAYCTSGGSVKFFNNTVECGPDSNPNAVCAAGIASAISAVELRNNHWITNATSPNNGEWSTNGVTPTTQTNLRQSLATATSQGYNSSQLYPFSPTAGGGTVGAGTNLTASCTGALTGLCSDSAVGVGYNATAHTVVVPSRNGIARPASGAWDIGAYQITTGSTSGGPKKHGGPKTKK